MNSLQERFEQKYIPEPNSGCWLWLGASLAGTHKYGLLRKEGIRRWQLAHRVSWQLHRGAIPDGFSVLHKCDVPACVNPDHLFLGTQSDNQADMVKKGRNGAARGENSGTAKLTRNQALDAKYSPESERVCARRLGVSRGCVTQIRRGHNWKDL